MKAFYNMDYNSVDIVWEDGCLLRIPKVAAEARLNSSPQADAKLIWLAEQEPMTYVQLALTGHMQEYVNCIKGSNGNRHDILMQQYRQKYSDLSDCQIESMVRGVEMELENS